MRLGSQSPHLSQDAGLLGHGPPCIREAHREVEPSHDGNSGCVSDDEVQVANAGSTRCLGDVATLVVHANAEPEPVPDQDQMPSGTAAKIEDPHPFL